MKDNPSGRPIYARVLRLGHLRPGGILCSLFFEGAVLLGVLLALAELTSWWAVPVLPLAVAAMVKVNDVVAGAVGHSGGQDPAPATVDGADPPRVDVPRPAVPAALRPAVARASVPGFNRVRPPVQHAAVYRGAVRWPVERGPG